MCAIVAPVEEEILETPGSASAEAAAPWQDAVIPMAEHKLELSGWNRVDDMRARLRALNAATYGAKDQLWQRLQEKEAAAAKERHLEQYLKIRQDQLARTKRPLAPVMLPCPAAPSQAERDLHMITHLPAARWCEHCMRGKGRADGHRLVLPAERDKAPPRSEFDYMFMKSDGTILVEEEMVDFWASTLT